MADFKWTLDFDVSKAGMDKIIAELQKAQDKANLKIGATTDPKLQAELQRALGQVKKFEEAVSKAFNVDLNKLDMKKFMSELTGAGLNLNMMRRAFAALDGDGNKAMASIERRLRYTGLEIKKTNKALDKMADTFKNSLRWTIASSSIHAVQGSIERAIGFVKALDESMNNIRVVTKGSSEDMQAFAKTANEAAKALGKTTVDYTDASLLFFQQGKSRSEVEKLTQATLVGANITGQEVSQTAELLTAALNGYNLEADKAMEIMDKFAAVGASTGSDFNELATGFSKVASMANTAGVSVDKLNGMLATVSTVTREAPESIGTSFKTILGRMTEVKSGKADEEGWTLGKVEETFKKVGMSVLDTQGKMKDMGVLIDEVGEKWSGFNKETKMAMSIAMAGNRQQNRLIALFNNWEMYKEAVQSSMESEGEAYQQNLIRMDSISVKSKQLKAELEELWMKIINSDAIKEGIDLLTSLVEKINDLVDNSGGMIPILQKVGILFAGLFSRQIANGIGSLLKSFKELKLIMTGYSSWIKKMDDDKQEFARNEVLIHRLLGVEQQKEYQILVDTLAKKEELKAAEEAVLTASIQKNKEKIEELEKEQLITQEKAKQAKLDAEAVTIGKGAIDDLKKNGGSARKMDRGTAKTTLQVSGVSQADIDSILGVGPDNEKLWIEKQIQAGLDQKLAALNTTLKDTEASGKKGAKAIEEAKKKLAELESTTNTSTNTINNYNNEISQTRAKMEKITTAAKNAQKSMMLTAGVVAVAGAFVQLTNTIGSLDETMSKTEKRTKITGAVFSSLGGALMMIPHPAAQVAGVLLQLGAAIIPFIKGEDDLTKAVKRNEEVVKSYRQELNKLNQDLKDTRGIKDNYLYFQEQAAKGIGPEEIENFAKTTTDPKAAQAAQKDLSDYYGLMEQMSTLYPELIQYHDDHGRAIVDLSKSYDELIKKQKDAIKVQNDIMVSNGESFSFEYSERKKQIEQDLYMTSMKEKQLQSQKKMKAENGDYDGMQKTQKELSEVTEKARRLQTELSDIKSAISANIVLPFMNANNAIGEMDDKSKKLMASFWNYESVSKAIYTSKNYKAGIEDLKTYTLSVAGLVSDMSAKAKDANSEAGKSFQKLMELAPATQKAIVDSVMSMPLSMEQQTATMNRLMQDMIKNKETYLKRPLRPEDLIPVDKKERDAHLQYLKDQNKEMEDFNEQIKKMTTDKDGKVKYQGFTQDEMDTLKRNGVDTSSYTTDPNYGRQGADSVSPYTQDGLYYLDPAKMNEGMKSIDVLRDKTQGLADNSKKSFNEMDAAVRGYGRTYYDMQMQLDDVYKDQLYAMSDSVEGYNTIVDAYQKQQDAMGGVIDKFDTLGGLTDDFFGTIDQFDGMVGGIGEVAKAYDMLGESLQALDLTSLKDDMPGIADALQEVADKGGDASAESIEQVYTALDSARNGMSAMFLALNKDNEEYYSRFKTVNQAQINDVFLKTGIMADNYKNYAEYEEAINDQLTTAQMANTDKLADKDANAALEKINTDIANARTRVAAQISSAQTSMKNESTYTEGYKQLQKAKAQAAVLAQLDSEKKQIESNLRIVDSMMKTLEQGSNALSRFFNVGAGVAYNQAKTEFETLKAKLKAYDEEISNVASGKIDVGNGALGVKSNYDIKLDDWNFNAGTSNKSGGYKGIGGAKKKAYSPKTSGDTSGPGVTNPGKSGSGSDVQDMDFDADPLHDTNNALKEMSSLLDEIKDKLKDAYGTERLQLLERQKKILEDQKSIYQQQLTILQQQANTLKGELAGKGVTFDADGSVTNYNQIIQSKVNAANALSGDAKKKAIDEVKEFMEDLKEYENFQLNIKVDKEKALREVEDAIEAVKIEKFEYGFKIKLEISEDQKDLATFLKDMAKDFEDISDKYSNTMAQLKAANSDIATYQQQINDLIASNEFDADTKRKKLEEYEGKLQDATKNADALHDELKKINEDALKKGVELLDKHVEKFERINDELDSLADIMKLIGEADNYQAMDAIYEAQEKAMNGQLDALLKARSSMADYIKQLKVGSEEWETANEQMVKLDEQIQKTTKETLKLFQDELKNTVGGIMDKLDSDMFGGVKPDEVARQWKKMKEEQEKYLSVQEKIVSLGQLQSKIQQQLETTSDPKAREQLQSFMDNQLADLKEKDKLTKYDVQRAEKMYDITLKQIALDEARNNRTIARLVRDAAGNWSYQYVEDTKKVNDAQNELSNSLSDLMESDKEQLDRVQDEMLEAREQFSKRMREILEAGLNGEYESQEAMYADITLAQNEFNTTMARLQEENGQAIENASESALAAVLDTYNRNNTGLGALTGTQEELLSAMAERVGTNWTEISRTVQELNSGNYDSFRDHFALPIGEESQRLFEGLTGTFGDMSTEWDNNIIAMIGKSADFSGGVNTAITDIKAAWEDYQTKVNGVTDKTGTDIDSMIDRVDSLGGKAEDLGNKTDDVIGKIDSEWDAVSSLVTAYQALETEYDTIIQQSVDFVKQLDAQIAKMKEAANKPAEPTAPTPTPEPTPPPAPEPPPPSRPSPGEGLTNGRKVQILGSTVYSSSTSTRALSLGSWVDKNNAYVQFSSGGRVHVGTGAKYSSANAIGWFNPSQLQAFRTGGYTGEWGNDGKLGVLHEKEIVLNQDDTSNLLKAIQIVRDYAAMLKLSFGNGIASMLGGKGDGDVQQNVTINADFSGVKSSFEIEKAFENISNRAAQFASQRRPK